MHYEILSSRPSDYSALVISGLQKYTMGVTCLVSEREALFFHQGKGESSMILIFCMNVGKSPNLSISAFPSIKWDNIYYFARLF